MNKKFTILLIISIMLVLGYVIFSHEKQADIAEVNSATEDWDIEELFAEIEKDEDQKLKPICEQEMIPAEYASDCYFRELKDCEGMSGKMIPRSELEKCLPVFLKEEIENVSY